MPHLNRAVNDPLLASSSYQAYSYQNPVVGEPEVATDIIKAIEGWEDRLAECGDMGNPTRLADIDESLRDFLVENQETIQPLIDKSIADKA